MQQQFACTNLMRWTSGGRERGDVRISAGGEEISRQNVESFHVNRSKFIRHILLVDVGKKIGR